MDCEELEDGNAEAGPTEKGEDVVFQGMDILGAMSPKEVKELVERIDAETPFWDKQRPLHRERLIKWDNVAFGNFSAKQCRLAWNYLMTNVRTYRIMKDIVAELKHAMSSKTNRLRFFARCKQCPKRPSKATNGVYIYAKEKWDEHVADCAKSNKPTKNFFEINSAAMKKYIKLPDEQKQKYKQESKIAKREYEKSLQSFCDRFPQLSDKLKYERKMFYKSPGKPKTKYGFPDAPKAPHSARAYYIQGKLDKLETPPTDFELPGLKDKYLEKYQKLSETRKAKWIDYTINCCELYEQELKTYQQQYPEYSPTALSMKLIIKKPELVIWEKFKEKPKSPPGTVYDLFVNTFLEKEENAHLSISEARSMACNAFQELDWHTKEQYKIDYKMLMKNYKKDIREYYEKTPNIIKPLILNTIQKKFHPYLIEVDKIPAYAVKEYEALAEEKEKEKASNLMDGDKQSEKKDKKRKKEENLAETEENSSPSAEDGAGADQDDFQIETEVINLEGGTSKKRSRRSSADSTETVAFPGKSQDIIFTDEKPDPSLEIEDTAAIPEPPVMEDYMASKKTLKMVNTIKPFESETPELSERSVQDKPSLKDIVKSKVQLGDMNDAIRGIFDGRSHLGRRYSVYYFYAKYVAQDKAWVECMNTYGVLNTADKIVETFVGLTDNQKQIFIDQSYNFFLQKQYGINLNGTKNPYAPEQVLRIYPGEPLPPPRTACKLYQKEVELLLKKSRGESFPKWENLHPDTQMLFVKKLYQETQLYIKKFEEFIMQMTANDLIEYTVFRARIWENNYLNNHAATSAVKGFIFPLPYNEYKDDGIHSDPEELPEPNKPCFSVFTALKRKKWRTKVNPFAQHRVCGRTTRSSTAANKSDYTNQEYSSEDEFISRPVALNPMDTRYPRVRDEVKAFVEPLGLLGKPNNDILYKRASKYEINKRKKAADAIVANEKRIRQELKKESTKIRRARTLHGKNSLRRGGPGRPKKVKVLTPKVRNDSDADEDLPEEDEHETNAVQNENEADCSDFLQSLGRSPSKQIEVAEDDNYDFDTSQLAASGVPDVEMEDPSSYPQMIKEDEDVIQIEEDDQYMLNEEDIVHNIEIGAAGASFFLESEPFDMDDLQSD